MIKRLRALLQALAQCEKASVYLSLLLDELSMNLGELLDVLLPSPDCGIGGDRQHRGMCRRRCCGRRMRRCFAFGCQRDTALGRRER